MTTSARPPARGRVARVLRDRRWLVALVLIVLAGGALRAAEAADPRARQSADEAGYVRAAVVLGDTGNYRRVSLHWPPAAPVMFALAYRVGGGTVEAGNRDIPAAYWAQWAVSTATIPVVFAAAALLAGGAAGALAAAVVAFYPPLAAGPAELLSEPLGTFLLTAGILLLVWALRRGLWPPWRLALAGFVLGLAVLARANFLLTPFAVAAVLLLVQGRRAGWRRGAAQAGVLLAGALVPVVAWSAHVSLQNDRVIPVTTGGGATFFIGTWLPGEGRLDRSKPLLIPEVRRRFGWARRLADDEISGRNVMSAIAARRPRLERDEALRAEGWDNVRRFATESPLAYAAFFVRKLPRMWLVPSEAGGRASAALRVGHPVLVLGALVALLLGVIGTRDPALAAILAVLAVTTAIHFVTTAGPRYALPLLPSLWIGAAAALVLLWRRRGERSGAASGDPSSG